MSEQTQANRGYTGDALIQLADSNIISVRDLQPGDIVWGGHLVKEIVQQMIDREYPMVLFNTGLTIHPLHPIQVGENTDWIRPCDVDYICKTYVKELYDIILETGTTVNLNGFQVETSLHLPSREEDAL
jgi:hypothetical protein